MTETLQSVPPATDPAPPKARGTWSLSWSGVATVARLELRQRVRSTRWIIVLAVWALVLGTLAALIHYAIFSDALSGQDTAQRNAQAGATMFGLVVLLVLSLGSLVAPALSATSINGDRSAGVLATLQTTLLTPAEITVGKLLAAWLTALALLAVALPFILWAVVTGGTPLARLVVTVALLAVVLLVVCAIGLGWSAIAARMASSAVMTYLSVAFLGLGLPVLFGLTIPLVTTTEVRTVYSMEQTSDGSDNFRCVPRTEASSVVHTERNWWILVANPFVVIADAAPMPRSAYETGASEDVLSSVRNGIREIRLGEDRQPDYCDHGGVVTPAEQQRLERRDRLGAVWPYGLAAELLVAAGFTVLTVLRLRAPARRLPRGTRVA